MVGTGHVGVNSDPVDEGSGGQARRPSRPNLPHSQGRGQNPPTGRLTPTPSIIHALPSLLLHEALTPNRRKSQLTLFLCSL